MIERFRLILEQLKLSPSEFADRIGVQRSNISHVLSGRSKPGIDFLEKMLLVFPEVDIAWLITGNKTSPVQQNSKNEMKVEDVGIGLFQHTVKTAATPEKAKPLQDEEAVDRIIIVFKNNKFRILSPENPD